MRERASQQFVLSLLPFVFSFVSLRVKKVSIE